MPSFPAVGRPSVSFLRTERSNFEEKLRLDAHFCLRSNELTAAVPARAASRRPGVAYRSAAPPGSRYPSSTSAPEVLGVAAAMAPGCLPDPPADLEVAKRRVVGFPPSPDHLSRPSPPRPGTRSNRIGT